MRTAILLLRCSSSRRRLACAQETPRMGGVLKVASIGEPPTLDIPMSTATLVYEIMWHVNESLFTYDKGFNPVPLLAESHTVTDKGLRHTITLRKGVKFHNGKEMTSADVVPSLQRWGRVASIGRSAVEVRGERGRQGSVHRRDQPEAALGLAHLRPVRAARARSIRRRASRPRARASSRSSSAPARTASSSTSPDRHIKLARFKDYSARAEPPAASGASAPPTSTRSCSSPCPTPPCAWPASRPASTTTRCSSSRTPTIASRPCRRSSRGSSSRAAGRWRC